MLILVEKILNGIRLPESVKTLNNNTFIEHDIKTIIIHNNISNICSYAFYNCSSLSNILIPYGVTEIGSWSFSNCSSLTDIIIPDSVISIGDYAFSFCDSLKDVVISSKKNKKIGQRIFYGSNAKLMLNQQIIQFYSINF